MGNALETAGLTLHGHPGLGAIDDLGAPRTQAGKPYSVFSAFHRSWEREGRREVLGAPRQLPRASLGPRHRRDPVALPRSASSRRSTNHPRAAEHEGASGSGASSRAALRSTARSATRSAPAPRSRLSPYLHFGCVSAREVEHRLGSDAGPPPSAASSAGATSTTTCCSISPATPPRSSRRATAERSSGVTPSGGLWRGARGAPGTRSSTRACANCGAKAGCTTARRLVVGSFLTKDLGIDWRWGERHFMRLLVDGDEANNNGNWQWIASVGTDPQPAYRRIYNPTRQMEAYDPDGSYVRRHVPELKRVPDELHPRAVDDAGTRAARGGLRAGDATIRSRSWTMPTPGGGPSSATGSARP